MTLTSVSSEPYERNGVKVDSVLAHELLDQLMDNYLRRQALYRHVHQLNAPQTTFRPEGLEVGSVEHARWLFFAAMTDRREQSSQVYKGHGALWGEHPELYNEPLRHQQFDLFLPQEGLLELIGRYKIGMPASGVRS